MRPALLVIAIVGIAAAALAVWWLAQGEDRSLGRATKPAPKSRTDATSASHRRKSPRPRSGRGRFDPAQDPAAPESAAAVDPNALAVIGKVIDERRKPVPQASIEVVIDRRATVAGRTGADGRFRIAVGPRPRSGALRGAVQASDDRGRVALVSLPADPADRQRDRRRRVVAGRGRADLRPRGAGRPARRRRASLVRHARRSSASVRSWPTHAALVGTRKLPHGSYHRDGLLRGPRVSRRRARRRSPARRRRSARGRPRARVAPDRHGQGRRDGPAGRGRRSST